ncbi:MAG: diaminopimelate epimerase [Bacteroidaceae bacterium]|nr:diaminopimelate epimerase [Bacteroidaceae bacterium]
MKIDFTKMHGAGNDYIYINTILYNIKNPEEFSRRWSRYHFGIGSDGIILIGMSSTPDADYSMRIFNADGSEAMMCGNGTRCVAKYLHDKGITDKTIIRLETMSGIKILHLHLDEHNHTQSVTVDMGKAETEKPEQFDKTKADNLPDGTFVCMGNPHYVIFIDEDVEQYDIAGRGSELEHHPAFPERCNIEFAQLIAPDTIRMRVWERGSGITLACGTGACATAMAAKLTGRTGEQVKVVMDGGTLDIDTTGKTVLMTGPAEFVFDGWIEDDL